MWLLFFIIFISQSYLSADEFPIERRNPLVTTGRLTGPSVCLTSIGIDKKWNFCHISWLLQILNFQLGENILISFKSRQQVIPSSHLLILWDFYIFWHLIKHKVARVQNKGFLQRIYQDIKFWRRITWRNSFHACGNFLSFVWLGRTFLARPKYTHGRPRNTDIVITIIIVDIFMMT